MKTWTFIVSCLFLLQLQGCEPDNTGNHASPEKLPETNCPHIRFRLR